MPTTNARMLRLTETDDNVTINVTYNVVFSPFERFLAANGLRFVERISVIGVDPPGATTGTILHVFPRQTLPVTAGETPQTIARNRERIVTRAALEEDIGIIEDADEIRCRIEISPIGMPVSITDFTNQEVIGGPVFEQPSS